MDVLKNQKSVGYLACIKPVTFCTHRESLDKSLRKTTVLSAYFRLCGNFLTRVNKLKNFSTEQREQQEGGKEAQLSIVSDPIM